MSSSASAPAASPIFIVGCPRSGTSLLRDMLHEHPNLAFPTESHFIPVFFKAYGDPQSEDEARCLAARILNLRWVRSWKLALVPENFAHDRSFEQITSRLYEEFARQQKKRRWGDKTPQYVAEIPLLHSLFPHCKIIHLYRDGRDVALSWIRVGLDPQNIFTAAITWQKLVSKGRRDGACLSGSTYLEVRYEDLIAQPKEVIRNVCEFLDEPFHEAVFRKSLLRRNQRQRRIGQRDFGISHTDVVPTNREQWKAKMSPRSRLLFESLAGDLLVSLGYEVTGVIRPISKPERLTWRIHHSFWWVLDRINSKDFLQWLMSFISLTYARILYLLVRPRTQYSQSGESVILAADTID